ncbi:hypothetical protein [Enterobacter ludwigii]|uniref:hypothetical protein n=1 Tax=Enterobacter ludwigii TaxID=299767 RepID=UPI003A8F7C02
MFLSTFRYEIQRPTADAQLSGRIIELALEQKRFGCRGIWQLLRRFSHKRVYHLNSQSVKCRRRRKGLATESPLLRLYAPNLTWSMDFVMDALASGCRVKSLTGVDDFTKGGLTITAVFGISGVQATRILDRIALPQSWLGGAGIYLPSGRSMGL